MTKRADDFNKMRETGNDAVMRFAGLNLKRFYSLDSQIYRDGAIPAKTKELLGFATSLVLRCDDCIMYHLLRCHEEGVTSEELEETTTIALAVGGSITIPHIRRAMTAWGELLDEKK